MHPVRIMLGAVVGAVVGMLMCATVRATETQGPALEMRWNYGNLGLAVLADPMADGSFVVLGTVIVDPVEPSRSHACFVHVDRQGAVISERVYNNDRFERIVSARATADGGYVMAGNAVTADLANTEFTLLKIDAAGTLITQQFFPVIRERDQYVLTSGFIITADLGCAFFGNYYGYSFDGFVEEGTLVVKTTDDGQIAWQRRYNQWEDCDTTICRRWAPAIASMVEAVDGGGYLIVRNTSEGGDERTGTGILRVDDVGEPMWLRYYNNYTGSQVQGLYPGEIISMDGGYVVVGATGYDFAMIHATLMKIDLAGNRSWLQVYGAGRAVALSQTPDNGFVITGTGAYVAKTDPEGGLKWEETYADIQRDEAVSVRMNTEGSYFVTGFTRSDTSQTDWLVVKTAAPAVPFIRADSNGDADVDISDSVNTLNFLFLGSGAVSCADAADANDSGDVDISDAIFTLNFLFAGGVAPPPEPYPDPGPDPTDDALTCARAVPTG